MLGIDFLTRNKAAWDFVCSQVSFHGRPHPLVDDPSRRQWVRRVKLVSDIQFPARTQMNLPCQVELKTVSDAFKDTNCWGTSPATLRPSLYLAGTLLPADKYVDVPVCVMNVGVEPRTVKAGTVVGELEYFIVDSPPASAVEPRSRPNPAYPPAFGRYVPSKVRATALEPDLVEDLIGHVDDVVPESMVCGLRDLLTQYQDVFSKSEYDLGSTSVVTHRIETESARPVRQLLRRYPPAHLEAISKHVDNFLQQGVIEPATNPGASNIVLVRKKDNSYRCCIDYRGLNNVTVKDRYPLPRVDSCLEAMTGASWFSSIDLRASYHQVSIWPPDRDKTSFICQRGLYRYRMMPFGLCNAGATFQRLMDIVLAVLHMDVCLVYLDDIVVFSKTPAEHLERLNAVFQRLRSAGLKIKPEKCAFFRKSIVFLNHVLSADGISTDPEKIRAVVTWPTPTSVSEVRSFVGLAYYRKYVKDFAKIAAPLHELTKKNARFTWGDRDQEAFESLKLALTTPPILAMPTDDGEFCLDTDACEKSIGAVLSQRQDGVERVIAYASKGLDVREASYCITRKELLAIVYFLKQFKQYLLGRKFIIRTDHAALTWLRRTPDPIGQNARWLEQMEEYDFQIVHRPGTQHGNADALSRRPCDLKGCVCDRVVPVSRTAKLFSLSSVSHEQQQTESTSKRSGNKTTTESSRALNVHAPPFISGAGATAHDDVTESTSFVPDVSVQSDNDHVFAMHQCDVIDEEDTRGDVHGRDDEAKVTDGDESSAVGVEVTRGNVGDRGDQGTVTGPSLEGVQWTHDELVKAQRADKELAFVYDLVAAKSAKPRDSDVSAFSEELRHLCSFWPRLEIRNDLLCRRFEDVVTQAVHFQIILPKLFRESFLQSVHSGPTAGHMGLKKTAAAVQARVFWPSWFSDLSEKVS